MPVLVSHWLQNRDNLPRREVSEQHSVGAGLMLILLTELFFVLPILCANLCANFCVNFALPLPLPSVCCSAWWA
jgi:hypothetical protein